MTDPATGADRDLLRSDEAVERTLELTDHDRIETVSGVPSAVRPDRYHMQCGGRWVKVFDAGGAAVSAEAIAPPWMHELVTAQQYDSWSAEQCAGIEIVDGMIVVSPSASKRHNRIARVLANALDVAAGPEWNADTDFDLRLQDVPLLNRRPDVIVYRADTIDVSPTRPEHVLMVAEVVSPGSETTDRIVKLDQYAKGGIQFYWRIEQALTGVPIVYTYVLDMAATKYREAEVFTGVVNTAVPFPVTIDLAKI